MSGTSLDGIDAILASFDKSASIKIHRTGYTPYPDEVRALLDDLMNDPRRERTLAHEVDVQLGKLYTQAVLKLLDGYSNGKVKAIGCHGQTILHQPSTKSPFSWQAGDAKTLANQTGIPVVDDFRYADMQHGGQGAPLAPAFHQFAFSHQSQAIAVVNIGGIANATYLPVSDDEKIIGFDTGPGNTLSDRWIQASRGMRYDKNGAWAQSAPVDENLLARLMQDDYFHLPPPKSLDTRYFNIEWLHKKLSAVKTNYEDAVVQSTVAAFTAQSIWQAIEMWMAPVHRIVLCGGGAHNQAIVSRLAQISALPVSTTEEIGISPDDVEACTFAWLAQRRMNRIPANLPSVTGARKRVLLGSITYPQ